MNFHKKARLTADFSLIYLMLSSSFLKLATVKKSGKKISEKAEEIYEEVEETAKSWY